MRNMFPTVDLRDVVGFKVEVLLLASQPKIPPLEAKAAHKKQTVKDSAEAREQFQQSFAKCVGEFASGRWSQEKKKLRTFGTLSTIWTWNMFRNNFEAFQKVYGGQWHS